MQRVKFLIASPKTADICTKKRARQKDSRVSFPLYSKKCLLLFNNVEFLPNHGSLVFVGCSGRNVKSDITKYNFSFVILKHTMINEYIILNYNWLVPIYCD